VIKGKKTVSGRPGESMEPADFGKIKDDLEATHQMQVRDVDIVSAALYPKVPYCLGLFAHSLFCIVEKQYSQNNPSLLLQESS
jgi:hypothetical protein